MPYRNKSDRKKQVNKSPDSPEFRRRMARQEARREMDRTGKDANKNGKADKIQMIVITMQKIQLTQAEMANGKNN